MPYSIVTADLFPEDRNISQTCEVDETYPDSKDQGKYLRPKFSHLMIDLLFREKIHTFHNVNIRVIKLVSEANNKACRFDMPPITSKAVKLYSSTFVCSRHLFVDVINVLTKVHHCWKLTLWRLGNVLAGNKPQPSRVLASSFCRKRSIKASK